MAAAVAVDPARVQAARDAVLALPELSVERDFRARLFDWFIDQLAHLGSWLPAAGKLVALALLLSFIVWLGLKVARPIWQAAGADAGAALPHGPGASFASERERARAALAAGDLGEAVRAAWLAALALLDERGFLRSRAARADWEHVEQGRRALAELGEPLALLATLFQRSHFGARALARDEAEAGLAALTSLEQLTAPAGGARE